MSKIGGHRRGYVGFRGLWDGSQAELTSCDNVLVCTELMSSARVLDCFSCGKLPCLNPGLLRTSQQSHQVGQKATESGSSHLLNSLVRNKDNGFQRAKYGKQPNIVSGC